MSKRFENMRKELVFKVGIIRWLEKMSTEVSVARRRYLGQEEI